MSARAKKPEPKIVTQVCSVCGLDWARHGDEPTTETCIELLIAETVRLRGQLASRPLVQPLPDIAPYPWPSRPYIVPNWGPYWGSGSSVQTSGTISISSNQTAKADLASGNPFNVSVSSPQLSSGTPHPIAA